MATFAIYLEPGGILAWLVVGLVAGWAAGRVMKGGGYGIVVDIILGLVGAVVGGFLCGLVVGETYGFLGTIVVAFIGACVLIAFVRFVAPSGTRL
jgi:uncharacterized membrane protein YeaQ/YmgE (transglycosylase-associated protein family)